MSKFYVNFARQGNNILEIGYENGEKYKRKVKYCPTLYTSSPTPTGFTTLGGDHVAPKEMDNLWEASKFIKKYSDISGFEVFGTTNYEYAYINEQYPNGVEFDKSLIRVANIDIETESENGFPNPAIHDQTVTAIGIKIGGKKHVMACGEYDNANPDVVTYYNCPDERHLLMKFLELWQILEPDVITGWNVQFFDIPYLYNRITAVLGPTSALRMSPWGLVSDRTTTIHNKQQTAFDLVGIVILDYIELYKKFTYTQQESYKLDHIAFVEIGARKLDYGEYTIRNLHRKNFQMFIDYNIQDIDLVGRIDDKMKLIDMVLALSYDAKVNLNDVFTQVRMWDTLTHNFLLNRNIVVPQKKKHHKDEKFEGAYVKEPKPNKYRWVVSFDLDSLYPHLIMQYNLGPETHIAGMFKDVTVDGLLAKEYINDSGHCMAANGQFFRKDVQSFLGEMMQTLYNERKKFKKTMIEWQKKKELAKTPERIIECENNISKYNNLQLARKVQLNSAYGALGSEYFRFYDLRIASAVTLSGQLSIRWIENKVNGYMNKLLKTTNTEYIIASDTDSIYVNMESLVNRVYKGVEPEPTAVVDFLDSVCEKKLRPFIDKCYEELAEYMGSYQQKMSMKREAIAEVGIWTAKKRYILNVWDNEGVRFSEPKLKMTGIEAVKSTTPLPCRNSIKAALKIVMNGTESDLHAFNENFKAEFFKMPFEDVGKGMSVNNIEKWSDPATVYKSGTPIQVRGSIVYNIMLNKLGLEKEHEEIRSGEKIKFCYLKLPNPTRENVISSYGELPEALGLQDYIDYSLQYEKVYLEPLRIILNTCGWTPEPVGSLSKFYRKNVA
jgi:DNA polymerase elongation subunit (family B)